MEKPDNKTIAAMLVKPEGELGRKVAENMNRSNYHVIHWTIEALGISAGDEVLEIGFGNGDHIKGLLEKAKDISYTGVDISETMVQEASSRYPEAVKAKQVRFLLVPSDRLPFPDNTFDSIITVNTLYFWQSPDLYLKEIMRVLKPDGTFCLGIRSRDFMQNLPFVQYGFTLYNQKEVEALFTDHGFKVLKSTYKKEPVQKVMDMEYAADAIIISATK